MFNRNLRRRVPAPQLRPHLPVPQSKIQSQPKDNTPSPHCPGTMPSFSKIVHGAPIYLPWPPSPRLLRLSSPPTTSPPSKTLTYYKSTTDKERGAVCYPRRTSSALSRPEARRKNISPRMPSSAMRPLDKPTHGLQAHRASGRTAICLANNLTHGPLLGSSQAMDHDEDQAQPQRNATSCTLRDQTRYMFTMFYILQDVCSQCPRYCGPRQ